MNQDATALKPEVEINLGGRVYQLRMDHAALYEMNLRKGELDGAGTYAQLVMMLFAMLVQPHPFKSPKDLASQVRFDETAAAWELVRMAVKRGEVPVDLGDEEEGEAEPEGEAGQDPL